MSENVLAALDSPPPPSLAAGEKEKPQSAYRVSARRYRPKTFSEMVGQEALVQTLSNGIESGRLPHAFIFTGIRGVGKTTTARILARSLNCIGEDDKGKETIDPCGKCEQCRAIDEDRHLDVIEMDAASRTGVDDVREVIEVARYKAISARYKIYIIDEVHMLSKSAFNALLKTLEEPPAHVKFIFATTEIRKVPSTVLSRCMRFDLKRIDNQNLINLFKHVCKNEAVTYEEPALALIARVAEGSARDGLSILDQAITTSNNALTLAVVQQMLGVLDKTKLTRLFQALIEGKAPEALSQLDEFYKEGAEPLSILRDLLDLTHWLTVIKVSPEMAQDPTLSKEEIEQGLNLANQLSIPILTRQWQILLKGLEEAQLAPSTLQALRMILIRLAYVSALPTLEEIAKFLQGDKEEKGPSFAPFASAVNVAPSSLPPQAMEKSEAPAALGLAEECSPSPAFSVPSTFEEMVELFNIHNEPLLYNEILHDLRLIQYEPGSLTINLSAQASRDLTSKMIKFLKQWTGMNWIINISEERGENSLKEQKDQRVEEIRNGVMATPLVKAALETFPGTTLELITEIKG